ncbi:HEAT repeat domain-containing protein [Amycolatopsis tucumanensis]|uniref:HEAT repeat domain-containing protein n=1 Tax=Amycolatopsis tucumanensis TaxID=401106 RepID=UPI003CD0715B
MAAFEDERDDHGLRRWLLELIGEARSPLTLPTLAEQLYSEDESLRSLAVRGLEQLGTPPARQELWKARANGSVP